MLKLLKTMITTVQEWYHISLHESMAEHTATIEELTRWTEQEIHDLVENCECPGKMLLMF